MQGYYFAKPMPKEQATAMLLKSYAPASAGNVTVIGQTSRRKA
jgi:hypothetical protein